MRCSFLTTRIIFILLFRLLPSSPWSSELPSLSPWRNKLYKHTGTECYIPDITWLLLHQIYLSIILSAFFWLHLYCVTITAVRNGNNMDTTAPFATWHSYQQRCPRSTLARVELLYPALKAIRNLALLKMLGKSILSDGGSMVISNGRKSYINKSQGRRIIWGLNSFTPFLGLNSIVPSLNHLAVWCLKIQDSTNFQREDWEPKKNMSVKPKDFNSVETYSQILV